MFKQLFFNYNQLGKWSTNWPFCCMHFKLCYQYLDFYGGGISNPLCDRFQKGRNQYIITCRWVATGPEPFGRYDGNKGLESKLALLICMNENKWKQMEKKLRYIGIPVCLSSVLFPQNSLAWLSHFSIRADVKGCEICVAAPAQWKLCSPDSPLNGVQILAPPRGSSWWSVQRYHKFLRLKSPKDAETVNILEKKSLLTLLWIYKGLNIVWFTTPSLTSKAEGRKNLQVSSIYPPQKNSGRP